ncbi:hypothetical protein JC2156_12370 [Weissella koreensis KCTC 3621]|uniref:hypothetical protein n=1 Tax=Weissella koreensis TaxID=165096 RepID=UPI00026F2485|nr:hypothetical protein [Weissella koreensis]EJF34397.1 hypothetical protein JC2156_12370 [Weissella koreensis KCTC 3621]
MKNIVKEGILNSIELAIWGTLILRLLKYFFLKNEDGNFLILVVVPIILLTIIIHGAKSIYFKHKK